MKWFDNILFGVLFLFGFVFLLTGTTSKSYLEHLKAKGVLICKDANSTFSVTDDDLMETTNMYYMRLKPHGQEISYLDCEKK